MDSIAGVWWNEDRRDLFRSLETIVSEAPNPDKIGLCLDAILNDLELYDDPRQGTGAWLCDDELTIAEHLGAKLHEAVGDEAAIHAGRKALGSGAWADVREMATELLGLMTENGDFPR